MTQTIDRRNCKSGIWIICLIGVLGVVSGIAMSFHFQGSEGPLPHLALLSNWPAEIYARIDGDILERSQRDWFRVPSPMHAHVKRVLQQPALKSWSMESVRGIERSKIGELRFEGRDFVTNVSIYMYGKGTFCISIGDTVILLENLDFGNCGTELFFELEKARDKAEN